jgi:hypothetical protein
METKTTNQVASDIFDMFIVFDGYTVNMRGVEYSVVDQNNKTATIKITPIGLKKVRKNIAHEIVLDTYGWGATRNMSLKQLAALEAKAMEKDTLYHRIANELNGIITYNLNELFIL